MNMNIVSTCGPVGCDVASVLLTRRENWSNLLLLLLLHNPGSRLVLLIVNNINLLTGSMLVTLSKGGGGGSEIPGRGAGETRSPS